MNKIEYVINNQGLQTKTNNQILLLKKAIKKKKKT